MTEKFFSLSNYYFNPFALPVLLSSLSVLGLGLLAFSKNPRQIRSRNFFYFCLSISGWLFFASLNYFSKNAAVALFWYKYLSYNFVFLASPATYFMAISWSEQGYKKYKRTAFYLFGFFAVCVILNLQPALIITGNELHFYGYYVIFDRLGVITILFWLIPMVVVIIHLIGIYKKEPSLIKKTQVKLFIIGSLVGYTAFTDFLPAIFINKDIYPSGYLSFLGFVGILYYAMARYRMMEIDTVLHRTALWFISTLVLIIPAGVVIFVNSWWLLNLNHWFRVSILSLIILVFLVNYQFFKPRIDYLFRRRKYDYQKALVGIPSKIGTELELDSLINRLFQELKETLYIQNALLLLKLPGQTNYQEQGNFGYDKLKERGLERLEPVNLTPESGLISYLVRQLKVLEKDRIEVEPQYNQIKQEAEGLFNTNQLELLIPLTLKSTLIGFLGLGKKENLQAYTLQDIQLLEQLGQALGISLNNALHHHDIVEEERLAEEMRLGRDIQMGLLPKQVPQIPGLRLAGLMEPAKEIGGDYFDYFPKAKDGVAVVIGDVSGKGVAAGILMAIAKAAIHTISSQVLSPKDMLIRINKILYEYMKGEKFMTLLYLEYFGSENKVVFSSSGHEHILFYHARENRCVPIKSGGFMLGMLADVSSMVEQREFNVSRGDKLVLYTDGVIEAENSQRERFGLSRLIQAIERNSQKPAQELLNSLYQEVRDFMGNYPQYDDITMITMEARK